MEHKEWLQKYYEGLLGGRITKVGFKHLKGDGEPYPFFEVKKDSGEVYEIEVSRDEEGNGPGFLFGLPDPNDVEEHRATLELGGTHGWDDWNTGGGCTAWGINLDKDCYALITQGEGKAPLNRKDPVDLWFYYPETDDRDFVELGKGITLEEAVKFDFVPQLEILKSYNKGGGK